MPSKIEWTEETWNPIAGCTKCSPGCLNCYAERMSARLAHMGQRKYQDVVKGTVNNWFIPEWNNQIHLCDEYENVLDKPLHWRKPRRIFVCSMSDLFHPKVPFEFIDKVWDIINVCRQHTFQILTKRPERVLEYVKHIEAFRFHSNIWLGVSISNQAEADKKIPILLQIPAAVRWLSIEPMLEDIDLTGFKPWYGTFEENQKDRGLHWVIVGCESGPKRRPCNIERVRSIVEQCKAAGVACFVKQINVNGKVVKMPKGFPQEYPKIDPS